MAARTLQSKLKKRQPFDSALQEAMLALLHVADRYENRFGRFFREYGLTNSQYNVLRILRGEGKPLPSLEIAERMIHVVPAITGLIDRLEKQQLVTRHRCEEDRRVVRVAITDRGLALLKEIDRPLGELERGLMGQLSEAELRQLIKLLNRAGESVADEAA